MVDHTAARAARDKRVLELRSLGWSQSAIAAEVGCAPGTVSRVLAAQTPEGAARVAELNRRHNQANAERAKERRKANAERKAEYDREYRKANRERISEYRSAYRKANADSIQQCEQRYRAANGAQIRERKRGRWAATAEDLNAQRRENYDDDARKRARDYRLANIEASREVARRRKRRDLRGMDALDRLVAAGYRKAIVDDPCTYCGLPSQQFDHKQPLARGGTGHWWNLHRTCTDCNFRKHTKTHDEFLLSRRAS